MLQFILEFIIKSILAFFLAIMIKQYKINITKREETKQF